MNKKNRALLMLLGCALLWSTGGFLIKSVSLHPLAIAGGRSLIATLFLLAFYRKPKWIGHPAFIGSILAYAGTMALFTTATCLTTAANAILLQYSAPVFVCLFNWLFYREKPRGLDLVVIALVLAGMALFFYDSLDTGAGGFKPLAMLGNFLGLMSGVCFGLMAVLLRQVQRLDHSPESVLIYGNLLCFLISLPFIFQRVPAASDILFLLILGVFQIGLAYVLYNSALPQLSALELILVPIIEPLLNPLWVFFLKGEKPGPAAIAGGVTVLAVVTAWCLWRNKIQQENSRTADQDRSA